jgi:hypothetical protein
MKSVTFSTNFFIKILDNLYISDQIGSFDESFIKSNTIDSFINCTKNAPFLFNTLNIKVNFLNDTSTLLNHDLLFYKLDTISKNIYKLITNNKKVLVYCENGYSKSIIIILCYLLRYHNQTDIITINDLINLINLKVDSSILNNCNNLYICKEYRNYLIHKKNKKYSIKKQNNIIRIL